MSKLVGNAAPDPEALAKMRLARCGECAACISIGGTKRLLWPDPRSNPVTTYRWNKILTDNPCAGRWYAYQNMDLGHPQLGRLQFLHCGPGNTFKVPPQRMPDTAQSISWRYLLVGVVNLSTGNIEDLAETDEGDRS